MFGFLSDLLGGVGDLVGDAAGGLFGGGGDGGGILDLGFNIFGGGRGAARGGGLFSSPIFGSIIGVCRSGAHGADF